MDERKLKTGDRVGVRRNVVLGPSVSIEDDSKPDLLGIVVGIGPRKGTRGIYTTVLVRLDSNGQQIAAPVASVFRL
jgi:hypothetical protein